MRCIEIVQLPDDNRRTSRRRIDIAIEEPGNNA